MPAGPAERGGPLPADGAALAAAAAHGVLRVVGLMSGTSLDGIDAAWIETDGAERVAAGPALTVPYEAGFRDRLRGVLGGAGSARAIRSVEAELTLLHAAAVETLIAGHGLGPPDLVGFHGHTILHRPQQRRTWQIGDGPLLARRLGRPVISDFRTADVAAGGQGAPLVPVYHRALAAGLERPLAVLNIGGVANVTWIGDELVAFDTGPGNALLDDWTRRHTGQPFDAGGALAAGGRVDDAALARFLGHRYFGAPAPKSLDRDEFADLLPTGLSPADGAATLVAMTAGAVARAAALFPRPAQRWLATGGGRHNPALMAALRGALGVDIAPVESVGWDGDALEAQAFAYLAVRSVRRLPLTFPGTTGAGLPLTGGRLALPT